MTNDTSPLAGQYAEQIARGAAWLDENTPGWRQCIDLARLSLASLDDCIVGQLRLAEVVPGGYNAEFGFDLPQPIEYGKYAQLTAEWRDYIEATR